MNGFDAPEAAVSAIQQSIESVGGSVVVFKGDAAYPEGICKHCLSRQLCAGDEVARSLSNKGLA